MAELLEQALSLHQAGDLAKAQPMYESLLALNPDHHVVMHLLGVLMHQQGKSREAIALLTRSADLQPTAAAFGHLALALKATAAFDEAEVAFGQALLLAPDDAALWANLGSFYRERGQTQLAIEALQKATAKNPRLPEVWANLALAQQSLDQTASAHHSWANALALRPEWPLAQDQLTALKDTRYGQALELQQQGKRTLAIAAYREVLAIDPAHHNSLNNLGNLLTQAGEFTAAVQCFHTLIGLVPNDPYAYGNLGVALKAQRRYQEAIHVYRKALQIKPDYTHALNNLATILKDVGQYREALDCLDRALKIDPNYLDAHSNRLFTLSQLPDQDPALYLLRAREYGDVLKRGLAAGYPLAHQSIKNESRPLRVGFVSGDLKSHPVGYFMEGLLTHLDRNRVTPVAFATNDYEDGLSLRLKKKFEQWHTLVGLSDDQAAALVREQAIDILVDLAGHTAHHRLPVFARKPAPVQVSWLGYFASTGVVGMDYLLADNYSINVEHEDHFTEAIWRLPDTRLCFTPPPDDGNLAVTEPPALRNGFVTFASYQNLAKMNAPTVAMWSRVLQQLPGSRLYLQSTQLSDPSIALAFGQYMGQQGISPDRITMAGAVRREAYLRSYAEVDIVLDTFPFPGGTTTCEALWMGVPTVTLVGSTLLSRQGGSVLTAAGYQDWIAISKAQYIDKAIRLATDVKHLVLLRKRMRERVLASSLCDAPRFAQEFQRAMEAMWAARIV